jgi:hypothetical protein
VDLESVCVRDKEFKCECEKVIDLMEAFACVNCVWGLKSALREP